MSVLNELTVFMQVLCRLLRVNFRHPLTGVLVWLAACLVSGQALAQAGKVPPAPPVAPSATAAANASPKDKMLMQVRQWVGQSQNTEPAKVEIAPIDPRVNVQECPQALLIDLPFASRESVRVRCAQPAWQIYLRVQTAAPATPVPAATNAAQAAQAVNAVQAAQAAKAAQAAAPVNRTTVITRHLIQRGTQLQPAMLEEVSRPSQGLDPQAVSSLQDLVHGEAARDLPAGQVIRSSDIRRAVLVKQGQSALMSVGQDKGFQITVRVEALQDGRLGDQIRLKNPESGRLLSGVVTGPNAAKGL
jgi:flagella basal body P-ring formation protein FlgA